MPEHADESSWLIDAAEQFVRMRDWDKALAGYTKALALGENSVRLQFGMGVAFFFKNELEPARSKFLDILKLESNADAAYYLGEIASRQGRIDEALAFYRKALAITPSHSAAQAGLKAIESSIHAPNVHSEMNAVAHPPKTADTVKAPPASDSTNVHHLPSTSAPAVVGFMELIKRDQSPLAQEAYRLIEATKLSRTPLLSAHLGSLVTRVVIVVAVAIVVIIVSFNSRQISRTHYSEIIVAVPLLSFLVICVSVLPTIVRVKSTRIVFDSGRVQITSGVLFRKTENVELYRVEDLHLEQTFSNRITGDAALVLAVGGGHKTIEEVALVGLGKYRDLQDFFANLRSLILVLRTGPWGHGVIY